jgi:hypothetical protein
MRQISNVIAKFSFALAFWSAMVILACSFVGLKHVREWEAKHNYPYGRMCNSFFTGYADTCPSR